MRKKDILGNYVKRSNASYISEIRELPGELCGYSALIEFMAGNRALLAEYGGESLCLAADGYRWLMVLPLDEHWCMTAMYDARGRIVEWYFDITRQNYVDEDGLPCFDDLYLDLVLMPDGSTILLDEDELLGGLSSGVVTKEDYDFAHRICGELSKSKWTDPAFVGPFCDIILADYRRRGERL